MRSVITSWIEDVDRTQDEMTVYRLTNGLVWAVRDDAPGMADAELGRTTLFHDEERFYLWIEGIDALVEVTLIACRRKVWGEVPCGETMVVV